MVRTNHESLKYFKTQSKVAADALSQKPDTVHDKEPKEIAENLFLMALNEDDKNVEAHFNGLSNIEKELKQGKIEHEDYKIDNGMLY